MGGVGDGQPPCPQPGMVGDESVVELHLDPFEVGTGLDMRSIAVGSTE